MIQGKIVTGKRKAYGRDFDWGWCNLEDQSVCGDEINKWRDEGDCPKEKYLYLGIY